MNAVPGADSVRRGKKKRGKGMEGKMFLQWTLYKEKV